MNEFQHKKLTDLVAKGVEVRVWSADAGHCSFPPLLQARAERAYQPPHTPTLKALAMRCRCTVVLGTGVGNQVRTSSSSPMPCM
jgi:hypothetical protein